MLLLQRTQRLDFHILNKYCGSSCWNQIRNSTEPSLNWTKNTWKKKTSKVSTSGRIRTYCWEIKLSIKYKVPFPDGKVMSESSFWKSPQNREEKEKKKMKLKLYHPWDGETLVPPNHSKWRQKGSRSDSSAYGGSAHVRQVCCTIWPHSNVTRLSFVVFLHVPHL